MNKSLKQLDDLFEYSIDDTMLDYDYIDACAMTYEPILDREVKVHAPVLVTPKVTSVLVNENVREDDTAFVGAITTDDFKYGLSNRYSVV